jgi:NAD(P)-dependent dehydrogenase (short-subunit alcohol dehydrogenase family)
MAFTELKRMFNTKWFSPPQPVTESYEGRTVIVTGATSGVGLKAVYKFASLGASKVIIAARDLKKGELTRASIGDRLGRSDQLEVWELDMASFDSVAAFAKRAEDLDRLDIAILNAGVHRAKRVESKHGWEDDLQVNTLSSALLGILLLPKLKESRASSTHIPVLEFVNSGLHRRAFVSPEVRNEPNIIEWYNEPGNFSEFPQYKFTKYFLMCATTQLADQVSSGDVIITNICPGMVGTDIGRDHYFPGVGVVMFIVHSLIALTPDVGANAILSGTTQGETVHGRFWKSDQIQPVSASLAGEENKKLGLRIWNEIIDALKKDVPAITDALKSISSSH